MDNKQAKQIVDLLIKKTKQGKIKWDRIGDDVCDRVAYVFQYTFRLRKPPGFGYIGLAISKSEADPLHINGGLEQLWWVTNGTEEIVSEVLNRLKAI